VVLLIRDKAALLGQRHLTSASTAADEFARYHHLVADQQHHFLEVRCKQSEIILAGVPPTTALCARGRPRQP